MATVEGKQSLSDRESIGRDEMNLAEFPIALLTHRAASGQLTIHKERTVKLSDGRTVHQEWTVTAAPEYGLPQPCDEDVLLGLLKLASNNGFATPIVEFSQRALLQIIKWPAQGWSFKRIEQALARLKTTSIYAKNAFWDNHRKGYETIHFGIIDSYQLAQYSNRLASPESISSNWVRFSNEFFASIRADYIKPIDLLLYFSFESNITKRLFRFLDKKRYQKERFEIGLTQLATVHVGLSENKCKYPSWAKQQLDNAHQELVERGFLKSAHYDRSRDGGWKVVYAFGEPCLPSDKDGGVVVEALVARGVTRKNAMELAGKHPQPFIEAQIDVIDYVIRHAPKSSIRNPGGFLMKAIDEGWQLRPPGYVSKDARAERSVATDVAQVQQREAVAEAQSKADAIEKARAGLSESVLHELRKEAMLQVRKQVGNVRLSEDSPVVEAFLSAIIEERYVAGAIERVA